MELNELIKRAKQGNSQAQLDLGWIYLEGKIVPRDIKQALYWFEKSAEQGNFNAILKLGNLYLKDDYISKDEKKAFDWFKKGADLGDRISQYNLGTLFYYGIGTTKDKNKALYWFQKSAEQGFDNAQYQIGIMYLDGDGVTKNLEKGLFWLQKSAEQGHKDVKKILIKTYIKLGIAQLSNNAIPNNKNQAFNWFKKGAELGDPDAQYNLGLMYLRGDGIKQNIKQAKFWFNKSAEQGNIIAQQVLNEIAEIDKKEKNKSPKQILNIFIVIILFGLLNIFVNLSSNTLQYILNIIRQLLYIPVFLLIGIFLKRFPFYLTLFFTFITFSIPYFVSYYSLPIKNQKYIKSQYNKEINYTTSFKQVKRTLKETLGSDDVFTYAIYQERLQLDPKFVAENAIEKIKEIHKTNDFFDIIISLIPSVISGIIYKKLGWINNPGYIGLIYSFLIALLITFIGWKNKKLTLYDYYD